MFEEITEEMVLGSLRKYWGTPKGRAHLMGIVEESINEYLKEHPDETREEVIERMIKRTEWRARHPARSSA